MRDFLSNLIMQSREPAAIITPQQKPPDQTVLSPQPPETRRAHIEVTSTIIVQPRNAAYVEPNASTITMPILPEDIRVEMRKIGRSINETDF